ncbi:MAG: class I SAM-dependent methyltransferase, partial [Proteobacteria bacterium]|nr:class I SAM-dependent methyltransferase [Pseudomonadota bacterium]
DKRVLDLGCGDGIITERLLDSDDKITQAVLVDASSEMLDAAKERLKGLRGVEFIESTFEDIMANGTLEGPFDFVSSSLAIHHLTMKDKAALFDYIYGLLAPGGAFINIDVVLGPTDEVDDWYLADWCDWLRARGVNVDGNGADDTFVRPKRCKDIPGNKPSTLEEQLSALKNSGFKEVDCFYKIGTFTAFGGRKI